MNSTKFKIIVVLNETNEKGNDTLAFYVSTPEPYTGSPTLGYNMQGINYKFLSLINLKYRMSS